MMQNNVNLSPSSEPDYGDVEAEIVNPCPLPSLADEVVSETRSKSIDSGTNYAAMSLKQLRLLAVSRQIPSDDIEDARDSEYPRDGLIRLLQAYAPTQVCTREDLMVKSLKELRQMAVLENHSTEAIEDARDSEDPKNSLVDLLLSKPLTHGKPMVNVTVDVSRAGDESVANAPRVAVAPPPVVSMSSNFSRVPVVRNLADVRRIVAGFDRTIDNRGVSTAEIMMCEDCSPDGRARYWLSASEVSQCLYELHLQDDVEMITDETLRTAPEADSFTHRWSLGVAGFAIYLDGVHYVPVFNWHNERARTLLLQLRWVADTTSRQARAVMLSLGNSAFAARNRTRGSCGDACVLRHYLARQVLTKEWSFSEAEDPALLRAIGEAPNVVDAPPALVVSDDARAAVSRGHVAPGVEVNMNTLATSVTMGIQNLFSRKPLTVELEPSVVNLMSQDIMLGGKFLHGARYCFEGVVLDADTTKVRHVLGKEVGDDRADPVGKKRKAKQDSPSHAPVGRPVWDIVVADGLGPVLLSLWDDAVGALVELIRTSSDGFVLRIENFRVVAMAESDWNGKILSPMCMIQSNQNVEGRSGTVFTTIPLSQSRAMNCDFVAPGKELCLLEFGSCAASFTAPFRATLRGIVTHVDPLDFTTNSTSPSKKRCFRLSDEGGNWVRVCALGRCAESDAIAVGLEVVLYFCTGRKAIGRVPGMVYMMKDSVILPIRKRDLLVPERREMVIN